MSAVQVLTATAMCGVIQARSTFSAKHSAQHMRLTSSPNTCLFIHHAALPVQAVVGGQPLLIVGVAEPIVLLYKFMFDFASNRPSLPPNLFLPWCAWACTWTACMLWATAASGACRYIYKFTRFSGELFGMLIATLFLQQAVQGLKEGFHITSGTGAVT